MKQYETIEKVLRGSTEPMCCHEISEMVDLHQPSVSGSLSRLEALGRATKTHMKSTCKMCDRIHSFYNWIPKQERENKRAINSLEDRIRNLQSELTGKPEEHSRPIRQAIEQAIKNRPEEAKTPEHPILTPSQTPQPIISEVERIDEVVRNTTKKSVKAVNNQKLEKLIEAIEKWFRHRTDMTQDDYEFIKELLDVDIEVIDEEVY